MSIKAKSETDSLKKGFALWCTSWLGCEILWEEASAVVEVVIEIVGYVFLLEVFTLLQRMCSHDFLEDGGNITFFLEAKTL